MNVTERAQAIAMYRKDANQAAADVLLNRLVNFLVAQDADDELDATSDREHATEYAESLVASFAR